MCILEERTDNPNGWTTLDESNSGKSTLENLHAMQEKYGPGKHRITLKPDCGCEADVEYIDPKGFAYCKPCGIRRQLCRRCRKLRRHEINRLKAGEMLARY